MPELPQRPEAADALARFFYDPEEDAAALPALDGAPAPSPSPEPGAVREFLAFTLAGEDYAVAIERLREIVRDPILTEVPRAPAHVLGVITLRGDVVPVFDLRARLGLAKPESSYGRTRVVIMDVGRGPFGVVVDEVRQVVRLPQAAIEPAPPGLGGLEPEFLEGIARVAGRLVVLLAVERVLGDRGNGA